ncbi:hypothetical protein NLG97_g9412 [Lecanicillium saksenae]|uniref:Uncharacterized protein n=1 Tax=Lecanicillium saksenae TaxID=468837 RepID=A0ACC1QI35_9HYPO|nr:hypothetical protein NLG97_g9412 [Lecanicillium saksenae]
MLKWLREMDRPKYGASKSIRLSFSERETSGLLRFPTAASRVGPSHCVYGAAQQTLLAVVTPQGVSRHLVEDGMTEDEIRRLEEEEAHLDSEIQRAGGGRR